MLIDIDSTKGGESEMPWLGGVAAVFATLSNESGRDEKMLSHRCRSATVWILARRRSAVTQSRTRR